MTDVEILMKEYDSLRSEVIERVKTAFSHLAYLGAVVAFAFQPVPNSAVSPKLLFSFALVGSAILLYISIINWYWVGRIANHLQLLEVKINKAHGKPVLSWEGKVKRMSRWVLLPPREYPSDGSNEA
jgi:hypothetical protein